MLPLFHSRPIPLLRFLTLLYHIILYHVYRGKGGVEQLDKRNVRLDLAPVPASLPLSLSPSPLSPCRPLSLPLPKCLPACLLPPPLIRILAFLPLTVSRQEPFNSSIPRRIEGQDLTLSTLRSPTPRISALRHPPRSISPASPRNKKKFRAISQTVCPQRFNRSTRYRPSSAGYLHSYCRTYSPYRAD
jgi:hypothetical protein